MVPVTESGTGTGDRAWYRYRIVLVVPVPVPVPRRTLVPVGSYYVAYCMLPVSHNHILVVQALYLIWNN